MIVNPKHTSLSELHACLLAAVAPRPIALASTVDKEGNVNLSPFSFFNAFSANPPIVIFSPARRGRDNTTKHTYDNLLEVPETVINVVNHAMVEQVSLTSTEYDRGVNEFVKAGFSQTPSELIKPPRVDESPVAFECTIDDIVPLGDEGGAGILVIARVVMIHIQDQYLDAAGKLDTTKLDLVGRMGGNWYTRASGEALFEIPKPLKTKGIGIDRLPESIRNSPVLTGNNLGRLGNVERLPGEEAVAAQRGNPDVMNILQKYAQSPEQAREEIHRLGRAYLENGDTEKALQVLLASDPL